MTLNQLFTLAHQKSYYSRTDAEVWAALSGASLDVYQAVLAENRGFFIVWDTTTVQIASGIEEYALPQACTQLLRVREQTSSIDPWLVVRPALSVSDPHFMETQYAGFLEGTESQFVYYPYLKMSDAETQAQTMTIRFEPMPNDSRNVEIVYAARFMEITGPTSTKFLPLESDQAVLYGAVATLLGDNGDDPSIAASTSREQLMRFLQWVRRRQFQEQVTHVDAYIEDMD